MKKALFVSIALAICTLIYVGLHRADHRRVGETLPIADQEAALGPGDVQSNRLRVFMAPGDPTRGAADALVTLVAFCDFRHSGCKRTARTLLEAVLAYPNEARVILKVLPAQDEPESVIAARMALAAGEQGKFWEMHDFLFTEEGRLDAFMIEEAARRVGLDVARFRKRLESHELMAALNATAAYASKLGVLSAPALFLNGLRIDNPTLPFVHLKPRIEAELRHVRSLMESESVSPADVYRTLMKAARITPLSPRVAPAPLATTDERGPDPSSRTDH